MLTIGIDRAALNTSRYYLDLHDLAAARGHEADKFTRSIGQRHMAVIPPDESIVTMAANAAQQIIDDTDREQIDLVLFATETGIDQSKSAGIYVHRLLQLAKNCRIVELKQACYSATAALQLAISHVQRFPEKKALILAADIAKYSLETPAEASQGGGAVAMIISANPRLLAIEAQSGFYTEDAMDFWRPNYLSEALVDGKYSCELYLKCLKEAWNNLQSKTELNYSDIHSFCYHVPVPRLAEKAHQKLSMINKQGKINNEDTETAMHDALHYNREIGNCYTASLYISLLSLLDNCQEDLSGQRIGLYSYGSGACAEYFTAIVQENYKQVLQKDYHQQLLAQREQLDVPQYELFYRFRYPTDGSHFVIPQHRTGHYRLSAFDQHKPIYETTDHNG